MESDSDDSDESGNYCPIPNLVLSEVVSNKVNFLSTLNVRTIMWLCNTPMSNMKFLYPNLINIFFDYLLKLEDLVIIK